jgi:hypothetical protein
MKEASRAAALLMLGLALFHAYGIALILCHIDNSVDFPLFNISRGHGEPLNDFVKMKILVVVQLLLLVYSLRWLIAGLWKRQLGSWYGSIVLCCFLMIWYWALLNGNQKPNPGSEILIGYCALTLVALVIAAPGFLKQRNEIDRVAGHRSNPVTRTDW